LLKYIRFDLSQKIRIKVCGPEVHSITDVDNQSIENLVKIAAFDNVTPCSLIEIYERFGSTFCLHLQGVKSETCNVECYYIALFLSASCLYTINKIFCFYFFIAAVSVLLKSAE
jgi:hypothetical protein